jgi:hypothetical protein
MTMRTARIPLPRRTRAGRGCIYPPAIGVLLLALARVGILSSAQDVSDPQDLAHPHAESCSWTGGSCEWDYNMQAMTATFENDQKETFFAYVEPDVSSYYNQTEGTKKVVEPKFQGMFAKFVNLSPKSIRVSWYVPRILYSHEI